MRGRILVVDDEEDFCWLLTQRLTREGFKVAAATSGRKALALVEREPPDLIILDLAMPGMDGLETLRRIRERGVTAKAVVLTSYGTAQRAREAMALGVSEFLSKPFDLDRLLRIVTPEVEGGTRRLAG
ncbi:MAG: response regulator [Candidatus Rokubacteria bacterium]|nr:response regulator [Candidatus Rokubacteria bacterium]